MKKIPRLKLVKSHVVKCAGCHKWLGRLPQWYDAELGKGHQCEYCGCTSIEIYEGRPYGPKCSVWNELVDEFNETYPIWDTPDERAWFLSTVVIDTCCV